MGVCRNWCLLNSIWQRWWYIISGWYSKICGQLYNYEYDVDENLRNKYISEYNTQVVEKLILSIYGGAHDFVCQGSLIDANGGIYYENGETTITTCENVDCSNYCKSFAKPERCFNTTSYGVCERKYESQKINKPSGYSVACCKCYLDSFTIPLCDKGVWKTTLVASLSFAATTILQIILLCICYSHFSSSEMNYADWGKYALVRIAWIAWIFLLIRPNALRDWDIALDGMFRVEMLFTLLEDIPQLVASILFMQISDGATLFTLLSIIGSGISIGVAIFKFCYEVKKRMKD